MDTKNEYLKKRIEYLESEVQRLSNKVDNLQDTLRETLYLIKNDLT